MQLEPISPTLTNGYKADEGAVAHWRLLGKERADASPALVWEEGRAHRPARFRPAGYVHCQSIPTDTGSPKPRQRSRVTAPWPFRITSVIASTFSSIVHPEYFYHNVGYYARKKFREVVGYAFLRGEKWSVGEITLYAAACCGSAGLGRHDLFLVRNSRSLPASFHGPDSVLIRHCFHLTKSRLAHSAVHRFTILSITSIASET